VRQNLNDPGIRATVAQNLNDPGIRYDTEQNPNGPAVCTTVEPARPVGNPRQDCRTETGTFSQAVAIVDNVNNGPSATELQDGSKGGTSAENTR
jgi:hypothetical protein